MIEELNKEITCTIRKNNIHSQDPKQSENRRGERDRKKRTEVEEEGNALYRHEGKVEEAEPMHVMITKKKGSNSTCLG